MKDRVRAVLITRDRRLLILRRIRPGLAPYAVLPGGRIEEGDLTLEDALRRELDEEIGGAADIRSLIHVHRDTGGAQYIFLAEIATWDAAVRSGPEFSDPTRGRYLIDTVPLTSDSIAGLNLKPPEVADMLADRADRLVDIPDLRTIGVADTRALGCGDRIRETPRPGS